MRDYLEGHADPRQMNTRAAGFIRRVWIRALGLLFFRLIWGFPSEASS